MNRLAVFTVLSILFSSVLGLSSAQAPVPVNPLFSTGEPVNLPAGTTLVEGDILMPESYLYTRGAYQTWQWPNGIIYYELAPYISSENQSRMESAMNELETFGDIRFEPRYNQPNFIYIIEDGANYSYVGMVRGRQELSIYNWNEHYVIIHELMHALGIWHEQSRTDRDDYVVINYDNIIGGYEANFNLRTGSLNYGPYDFCSVMHYHPYDFSWNNLPTIVAKPGYEAAGACMGNRTSMSAGDKATVGILYDLSSEVPGDRPGNAIELPSIDYFTYTSPSAALGLTSDEPVFPCASEGKAVTNTVWFEVTPDYNRYIDVYSGGYDTVLVVYSGDYLGTSMFMEACSDNYGAGINEWIGLPLENGNRYFIGVGSWAGSSGQLGVEVFSYRNLLMNGSFDWKTKDWKRAPVPAGRPDDKVKCGRTGAFYSLCALNFTGGRREGTSFTQTINSIPDADFEVGDDLWLSYMVRSGSVKNKVMVKATIVYADGTKQKLSAPTTVGSTYGYYLFKYRSAQLTRSDIDKIVVSVINKSAGGKTIVDNLALTGDAGVNLRLASQRGAAPTKPQTLAPVTNQRGTQSSLLPVPPPAN